MREFPRTGGASNGRAASHARASATFKLASPYIEIEQEISMRGRAWTAANLNRAEAAPAASSAAMDAP